MSQNARIILFRPELISFPIAFLAYIIWLIIQRHREKGPPVASAADNGRSAIMRWLAIVGIILFIFPIVAGALWALSYPLLIALAWLFEKVGITRQAASMLMAALLAGAYWIGLCSAHRLCAGLWPKAIPGKRTAEP